MLFKSTPESLHQKRDLISINSPNLPLISHRETVSMESRLCTTLTSDIPKAITSHFEAFNFRKLSVVNSATAWICASIDIRVVERVPTYEEASTVNGNQGAGSVTSSGEGPWWAETENRTLSHSLTQRKGRAVFKGLLWLTYAYAARVELHNFWGLVDPWLVDEWYYHCLLYVYQYLIAMTLTLTSYHVHSWKLSYTSFLIIQFLVSGTRHTI